MAGQKITKSEFEDFICLYILDKMLGNPVTNPKFGAVVKKIKNAGMQSILYSYFQNVDSFTRVKYKTFLDSLSNSNQTSLFISEDDLNGIVETVVKLSINKENPNLEKLKLLQEIVKEKIGE